MFSEPNPHTLLHSVSRYHNLACSHRWQNSNVYINDIQICTHLPAFLDTMGKPGCIYTQNKHLLKSSQMCILQQLDIPWAGKPTAGETNAQQENNSWKVTADLPALLYHIPFCYLLLPIHPAETQENATFEKLVEVTPLTLNEPGFLSWLNVEFSFD